MMDTVRGVRMGVWRGISRLSLPKILILLALNALIIWVVYPTEETYDMSHLEQY